MTTNLGAIAHGTMPRPGYLEPVDEPGYGATLTRITGDTGARIGVGPEAWWKDARHGYSRRYPWNSSGTRALIEQRGGDPSKMVVDATSWAPLIGNSEWRGGLAHSRLLRSCGDVRWMSEASVMVGTSGGGLLVFDVESERRLAFIEVPPGLGFMGEGSLSLDATVVALGDSLGRVVIVDLLNRRVGPVYVVNFAPDANGLDNLTVSPLSSFAGGKLVVQADGREEYGRVFDFGSDLVLRPHAMDPRGLRMGMAKDEEAASRGFVATMSHATVAVGLDSREYFVGGVRTAGGVNLAGFDEKEGRVVAIDLETGLHVHVSAGANVNGGVKEAADQHCGLAPRGFVGVSYAGEHETDGRFVGEQALWPLDGTRRGIRFGQNRTNDGGAVAGVDKYRSEAHGVWRRDGQQVMFASNWHGLGASPHVPADIKGYVLTLRAAAPPPPGEDGPYEFRTGQYDAAQFDKRTGRMIHPADVTRMLNKAHAAGVK